MSPDGLNSLVSLVSFSLAVCVLHVVFLREERLPSTSRNPFATMVAPLAKLLVLLSLVQLAFTQASVLAGVPSCAVSEALYAYVVDPLTLISSPASWKHSLALRRHVPSQIRHAYVRAAPSRPMSRHVC